MRLQCISLTYCVRNCSSTRILDWYRSFNQLRSGWLCSILMEYNFPSAFKMLNGRRELPAVVDLLFFRMLTSGSAAEIIAVYLWEIYLIGNRFLYGYQADDHLSLWAERGLWYFFPPQKQTLYLLDYIKAHRTYSTIPSSAKVRLTIPHLARTLHLLKPPSIKFLLYDYDIQLWSSVIFIE